jgi:Glutathione S-transferase, N-terminal domain
MSSVNEKLGGVITMKYLALGKIGGRAGPLRFLMLAHGVDFEETLFPMSEWPAKKAAMIESGENPCGAVPVIACGDKSLCQTVAIMRYILTAGGIGSSDAYTCFQQVSTC